MSQPHHPSDELTLIARFVRSHVPMLLVTAMVVVAFVLIFLHHWYRGTLLLGLVVALAGVFRLVLPEHRVGLLSVRSRLFDTVVMFVFGATIVWLALTVDPLGTR